MTTGADLGLILETMVRQQATIQQDVSALRGATARAVTHLEVINERNRTADEIHRDFEARIRLLERFRYTAAGVSVIGGVFSGFLGYLLGHLVH